MNVLTVLTIELKKSGESFPDWDSWCKERDAEIFKKLHWWEPTPVADINSLNLE